MTTSSQIIRESGQTSAILALGFYLTAIACLLPVWGILIGFPEVLLGDPYRIETLSLAVLVIIGFAASFVFGTFYAVSSLLSGTGLWSRTLGIIHFWVHVLGLGWLVTALGGTVFLENTFPGLVTGGLLVLAGMICLILNLVVTSSRLNRWEPAQITVVSSLFWLAVCAVLGFALVVDQYHPVTGIPALLLIESHSVLALTGFLWLGLVGATLKLMSVFSISHCSPGAFSWIGCLASNTVLFFLVPVLLFFPDFPFQYLAAGLLLGGTAYAIDIARVVHGTVGRFDWSGWGALSGISLGLLVFLWAALGTPLPVGIEGSLTDRELVRIGATILVFATVPLVALSFSIRIIPMLIWRVRCAPYVGKFAVPGADQLVEIRGALPAVLCLMIGALYVLAGQFFNHPAGAQIGSISLLVGAAWSLYAILPSLQAFLFGIRLGFDHAAVPVPDKSSF